MKEMITKHLRLSFIYAIIFSMLLSPFIGSMHVIHALTIDTTESELVIDNEQEIVEEVLDLTDPIEMPTTEEVVDVSTIGQEVVNKSQVEIERSNPTRAGPDEVMPLLEETGTLYNFSVSIVDNNLTQDPISSIYSGDSVIAMVQVSLGDILQGDLHTIELSIPSSQLSGIRFTDDGYPFTITNNGVTDGVTHFTITFTESGNALINIPFILESINYETPNNYSITVTGQYMVNSVEMVRDSATFTVNIHEHKLTKFVAVYTGSTLNNYSILSSSDDQTIRAGLFQQGSTTNLSNVLNELVPVVFTYRVQNTNNYNYGTRLLDTIYIDDYLPPGAKFVPKLNPGWEWYDEGARIVRFSLINSIYNVTTNSIGASWYDGQALNFDVGNIEATTKIFDPASAHIFLRLLFPEQETNTGFGNKARVVGRKSGVDVIDLSDSIEFKLSGMQRPGTGVGVTKSGAGIVASMRLSRNLNYIMNKVTLPRYSSILQDIDIFLEGFTQGDIFEGKEIIISVPEIMIESEIRNFRITDISPYFNGNFDLVSIEPTIQPRVINGQPEDVIVIPLGNFTRNNQGNIFYDGPLRLFRLTYEVRLSGDVRFINGMDNPHKTTAYLSWSNTQDVLAMDRSADELLNSIYSNFYHTYATESFIDTFDLNNNSSNVDYLSMSINQFSIRDLLGNLTMQFYRTNYRAYNLPNEKSNHVVGVVAEEISRDNYVEDMQIIIFLPTGLNYVENSSRIDNFYETITDLNEGSFEPRVEHNFMNTGKTALIYPFGDMGATVIDAVNFMFLRFDTITTSYMDHGINNIEAFLTWKNTDVIQGNNSTWYFYGYQSGAFNTSRTVDRLDLNNNNNTNDYILSAIDKVNFTRPEVLIFHKEVRGDLDNYFLTYPAFGRASLGGHIDYRINLINNQNSPINQFTIIDLLPHVGDKTAGINRLSNPPAPLDRGSTFSPLLSGPITSNLDIVSIYYTKDVVGLNAASLTNNATWLNASQVGSDWHQVTAFKVVLNQGATLPAKTTLILDFSMDVPETLDLTSRQKAVNSFGTAITAGLIYTESNFAVAQIQTFEVDGYVFKDIVTDGIYDMRSSDLPFSNHEVHLYRLEERGLLRAIEPVLVETTTTNSEGYFRFVVTQEGNYKVRVSPQSGFKYTTINNPSHHYGHAGFDSNQHSQAFALSLRNSSQRINAGMLLEGNGTLSFTLELRDEYNVLLTSTHPKYNTTFTYQVTINNIAYTGPALLNGVAITITDVVTLHQGDTLTITGLDANTSYRIVQTNQPDWVVTPTSGIITGSVVALDNHHVFVNRIVGNIDIPVSKVWVGQEYQGSVTVELLANGNVFKTLTLSGPSWSGTFTNVPIAYYTQQTSRFVLNEFVIRESVIPRYTTSVEGSIENGFVITNTYVPETGRVTVNKVWSPSRPADVDVTFELLVNGQVFAIGLIPYGSDSTTIPNVPLTDGNGNPTILSVRENEIPFYQSSVVQNSATEFTITNTLREVPFEIPVTKEWINYTPATWSVVVDLVDLDNTDPSSRIIDTVTLTQDNISDVFVINSLTSLVNVNGILRRLSVEERSNSWSYSDLSIQGNVDEGFVLTNTTPTYTVTLDANITQAIPTLLGQGTYPVGTPVSISVSNIEGYRFIGWTTDETITDIDLSLLSTSFTMVARDVRLTAMFIPEFTLSYDGNDGTNIPSPFTGLIEGQTTTISSMIPVRTGYTFLGWLYQEHLYQPSDNFTMPNSNVILVAQWSQNPIDILEVNHYQLSYLGNGGSNVPDYSIHEQGDSFHISSIIPLRTGYTFLGWLIQGTSTLLQPNDLFTMPANNVVLIAQWQIIEEDHPVIQEEVDDTDTDSDTDNQDKDTNNQDKDANLPTTGNEYLVLGLLSILLLSGGIILKKISQD